MHVITQGTDMERHHQQNGRFISIIRTIPTCSFWLCLQAVYRLKVALEEEAAAACRQLHREEEEGAAAH